MNATYSFQTIKKTVANASLWGGFAIIHILVMMPLIPITFGLLVVDGFVFSFLLFFIKLTYEILIKSKSPSLIISPQTIFNYISLGVFIIILWLGSGLSFFYIIFTHNNFSLLIPTIPVRALIGLLLYTSAAIYDYYISHKETEEEEIETANENKEMSRAIISPEKKPLADDEMLERIAVKSGQKIQVILVPDIYYFQSDGDYVFIFTEKGKYIKEQTMKFFEEHLPTAKFVRIHRSCIVNVEMISRIELYKKQQQMLTLKNGHQIKTSVNGYKNLKSVLQL